MTTYIIKSSISLLLLFGLYWLLLRKEKLFVFNRFFLIFSVVFSLIIPFISIPVNLPVNEAGDNLVTAINSVMPIIPNNQYANSDVPHQTKAAIASSPSSSKSTLTSAPISTSAEKPKPGVNLLTILSVIYFSIVILLLYRFLNNIFLILHKVRLSEKVVYSGYRIALLDHRLSPFSFYNTIFIYKQDYLNNNLAEELLAHEFEHIKQSHSFDVVFIELVQIIYWFNPILIFYNRAIRANHEYLADNGVIQVSSDIKNYAENLISFVRSNRNLTLTSGFNQSLTRKRLLMLTKPDASLFVDRVRIIITSGLAVCSFLFLSCNPTNPLNLFVDLEASIGNFKELTLSQINADIRYMPLTSIEKTGITRIGSIDVLSDMVLVSDNRQCLLFDNNGKLRAKIYERGRSEVEKGGIWNTGFGTPNTIYIKNLDGFLVFDYTGKYLRTIDLNKEKDPNFYFYSWIPIYDSLIFVQRPNSSGHELNKAMIFNSDGDPVLMYRNHITLNRSRSIFSTQDASAVFNIFNNHFYFKELYNDTLFYLNPDLDLVPEKVFNLGKYSEPVSFREKFPPQNANPSGFVYINNIYQSKEFMLLDCMFSHNIPAPEKIPGMKQWYEEGKPWYNTTNVLGLYNKLDNTISFSKLTSTANALFTTGLYNDIDAGPRFYPNKQVNDSTFVMWMNAASFKDHIKSGDFKNTIAKFPDKRKTLEELGNKLTDFDEIILMYMTIRSQ